MATSSDFTGTLSKSSEEAFTFECDACKLDDKIQEAKYFCPSCDDYLCPTCETHHKKVKATRFHEIMTVEDIASDSAKAKIQGVKQAVRNACSCGQNEETNFYCTEHDACFCLLCKNVKHRGCSISSIDHASSGPSVLTELADLAKKSEALNEKAKALASENQLQKNVLEQHYESCKDNIRKFRSKLNLFLDECKRISLEELQQVTDKQTDQLEDSNNAVASMRQMLAKEEQLIKEVNESQDKCRAFIASTQLRKSLQEYDAVLEDVKNKLDIPVISFEQNKVLDDLRKSVQYLGKIRMKYNTKDSKTLPILKDAIVKHRFVEDIGILNKKKEPAITGLGFLKGGELLIADHASEKLALLDAVLQIKETLTLEGRPYDLALISNTNAVVTLPYEQTLLFVQTEPKLQIILKKALTNRCWGVAFCKGNIYVSCNFSGENPEILELVAETGMHKRSITCKLMGKNVSFKYIFNIATNQDGTRLYVSDYWSHQVLCMASDGQLIYAYSDPDMKYPRGILVDAADNALICSEASSNIHIVKSDGTKHRILLKSEHGIQTPFAIDYRINDGMLAIGCWQKGNLLAFLLKTD